MEQDKAKKINTEQHNTNPQNNSTEQHEWTLKECCQWYLDWFEQHENSEKYLKAALTLLNRLLVNPGSLGYYRLSGALKKKAKE